MTVAVPLTCACGRVKLEVVGAPITSTECCCNSCREAGRRMQSLPAARPIVDPNGATRFVLYRKDRVRYLQGTELLREFRLSSAATTRRVVASCCNAPVFLEFKGGHWLSLYGGLWPAGMLPPLELRTMTGDLPARAALPDDVPNARSQTLGFFVKLFGAWAAMGFRSPKLGFVNGEIRA